MRTADGRGAREGLESQFVAMHMRTGRNRLGRKADDLPIAAHGGAGCDVVGGNLVRGTDGLQALQALAIQCGASLQEPGRNQDIIHWMQAQRGLPNEWHGHGYACEG